MPKRSADSKKPRRVRGEGYSDSVLDRARREARPNTIEEHREIESMGQLSFFKRSPQNGNNDPR